MNGRSIAMLAVAGLAACAAQPVDASTAAATPVVASDFRTSGYVPHRITQGPYDFMYPMLKLNDPAIPVDAAGVAVYTNPQGEVVPHPVRREQYALAALDAYRRTGNHVYLDRALANARALVADSVERDGAIWFSYTFDWTYYQVTIHAPWWSSMAQGSALSLFVRLDRLQPGAGWRELAVRTFASFEQRESPGQPWSVFVDNGSLWLEEYAGDAPPLQVLNGHIWATYGLYDYYMLTGDERARVLFDGAATTVLRVMPIIRVAGGVSYYCARQGYCQSPAWQNPWYHHNVTVGELSMLAKMTGDHRFADWSQLLNGDYKPPQRPSTT